MRIFWIVLILILAGSGVVIFTGGDTPTRTPALPTSAEVSSSSEKAASDAPVVNSVPDAPVAEAPVIEQAATEIADEVEAVEEAISETADAVTEVATEAVVAAEAATEENELAIVDMTAEDIAEALGDEATPAPSEALTEAATEEAPAPTGWEALTETGAPAAEEAPAEFVVEHLPVTTLEDGRLQIGEKYTIAGKGTKEEPYALPWEFLVALREAYSPREGRKAIPDHFAYFEGKYVSIRGYLQFPLASPEPTECLVMLNQWDGCCIGVPPTPYDAIEVALSVPATQAEKFAVEGRIVGKLDIDPYLVGNWLIGLYLLGDATVDVSGSRSAEEVYGNTPSQMIPGQ